MMTSEGFNSRYALNLLSGLKGGGGGGGVSADILKKF